MSRNYVCDCCGTDLTDIDDDHIMHISYDYSSKDFCPECTEKIKEVIDLKITSLTRPMIVNYPLIGEDAKRVALGRTFANDKDRCPDC